MAVNDTLERKTRERFDTWGLNERVQGDLIALAHELVTVAGTDFASALGTIEREVGDAMETNILQRVKDTLVYNGDLGRPAGGGTA